MYGKHREHSDETKKKISESLKKKIKRIHLETGEEKIYASIKEILLEGFSRVGIWRCCTKRSKLYKGYSWSYLEE